MCFFLNSFIKFFLILNIDRRVILFGMLEKKIKNFLARLRVSNASAKKIIETNSTAAMTFNKKKKREIK